MIRNGGVLQDLADAGEDMMLIGFDKTETIKKITKALPSNRLSFQEMTGHGPYPVKR